MQTRQFTNVQIEEAAHFLKEGEPIAIPTETVYGLAAPIFNADCVRKIFSLKGRPSDNPLIAHVSSLAMVETIAERLPPAFFLLADVFWPGPLTFILPKKDCVPSIVSGGQSTVAVRMPSHPTALRLIEAVGQPLVAPSANLSGKPSPTCLQHVLDDFGGVLRGVVDGGMCELGLESTVLSLVHPTPTLLRPGAVTKEALEEILQMKIALPQKGEPVLSPGMKYRHYAPKAEIRIVSELPPNAVFSLSREAGTLHPKTFYERLREADRIGVDVIWVLLDSITEQDEALMNRLFRSAGIL